MIRQTPTQRLAEAIAHAKATAAIEESVGFFTPQQFRDMDYAFKTRMLAAIAGGKEKPEPRKLELGVFRAKLRKGQAA